MSTSMPHPAAGPVSPTRQQLDDLEALMQRMLALPVHPMDTEPEITDSPRPEPSLPGESAGLPPRVMPEQRVPADQPGTGSMEVPAPEVEPVACRALLPENREDMDAALLAPVAPPPIRLPEIRLASVIAEPRRPAWLTQPAASRSTQHERPGGETDETREARPRGPLPASAAVWPETAPEAVNPVVLPSWQRRPTPALLRPLVLLNAAFDGLAAGLGPVGGWLRHRRGRAVLGWAGLLLMAAAVVLGVLEWLGWTW